MEGERDALTAEVEALRGQETSLEISARELEHVRKQRDALTAELASLRTALAEKERHDPA